jgi:hypothetical protein
MSWLSGVIASAFALAVVVPVDVWVFADARRRQRERRPVELHVGTLELTAPLQWLAGCVVLVVLFVPLYLVARQQS